MKSKLTPPERRLLDVIERRMRRTGKIHDPPGPEVIEQSEHTRIGGPSRLAVQVRRNRHRFRHLQRIVISQNAPAWHLKAQATDTAPNGLQSILICDSSCYRELWYKTATRGHRAKIFLR